MIQKKASFYRFIRFLVLVTCKVIWRHRVYGADNVPASGGLLIAPNHRSYGDPPLVGISTTRDLHFVAKKELFHFKPFGWLIRALNAHPIDRRNSTRALRLAEGLLKRGAAVIMFPEGGRSRTAEYRPAKKGIGMVAARTGVPIVPAYIRNSSRMLRGAATSVTFGVPFYPDRGADYQSIADEVLRRIQALEQFSLASK